MYAGAGVFSLLYVLTLGNTARKSVIFIQTHLLCLLVVKLFGNYLLVTFDENSWNYVGVKFLWCPVVVVWITWTAKIASFARYATSIAPVPVVDLKQAVVEGPVRVWTAYYVGFHRTFSFYDADPWYNENNIFIANIPNAFCTVTV